MDTQHLLCTHCALGLSEPLGADGHWEAISTSLSRESSRGGAGRGCGGGGGSSLPRASCYVGAGEGSERENTEGLGAGGLGGLWDS